MLKFSQRLKLSVPVLLAVLLLAAVCLGQGPTAKPQPRPTRPAPAAKATRATLAAVVPAGKPCPITVQLNGTITTSGPAEVKYTWLSSDNSTWSQKTISFAKAGTEKVTETWQLGKTYSGWVQLKVMSPNPIFSPRANFRVNCGATGGAGKVTRATLAVVVNAAKGCPATVNFKGTITTNGPATVKYTWASMDGGTWPEHTLNFPKAGTENVTESRQVFATGTGWMQLKVLSPNAVMSPRGVYRVTCPQSKK